MNSWVSTFWELGDIGITLRLLQNLKSIYNLLLCRADGVSEALRNNEKYIGNQK